MVLSGSFSMCNWALGLYRTSYDVDYLWPFLTSWGGLLVSRYSKLHRNYLPLLYRSSVLLLLIVFGYNTCTTGRYTLLLHSINMQAIVLTLYSRALDELHELKSHQKSGRVSPMIYQLARARILDGYMSARSTLEQLAPTMMSSLAYLRDFNRTLLPLELRTEEQRIWRIWNLSPFRPLPMVPPLPLIGRLRPPLPLIRRPLSTPPSPPPPPPSTPPPAGSKPSAYTDIQPGRSYDQSVAKEVVDRIFHPHRKRVKGGGDKNYSYYICSHPGCPLLCRVIPDPASSDLFLAQVRVGQTQHANHPPGGSKRVREQPRVSRLFSSTLWIKKYFADPKYALTAKSHIRCLSRSRSDKQFADGFWVVLDLWTRDGEGALAALFAKEYGPDKKWREWYSTKTLHSSDYKHTKGSVAHSACLVPGN
jgi:hypothetical protein